MNTIMQFLESSFDWIWATSLWAGALVLIVLLVQALTGRWLSAKGRYFLSFFTIATQANAVTAIVNVNQT